MLRRSKVLLISIIFVIVSTSTVFAQAKLTKDVYKRGDSDSEIISLQQALEKDGVFISDEYSVEYGPRTERAVQNFQIKYGLFADGVAGKETIQYIQDLGLLCSGNLSKKVYKRGTTHFEVSIIQEALKAEGLFQGDTVSPYFGAQTEEAVKEFQSKYKLEKDGIVGGGTIKKLVELGRVTNNVGKERVVGNLTQDVYKKGFNNPEVRTIQRVLKLCGVFDYPEYTTYFGDVTEKAVMAFQDKYNLEMDGVVGGATLAKMKNFGLVSTYASRSANRVGYGEYSSWASVKKMLVRNKSTMVVRDFKTGITFRVKYTAGSNHADVEPLSKSDTNKMKQAWGGELGWERRPVLVFLNGKTIAASMTSTPHAGVESKKAAVTVSGRSGGYGTGFNYDYIKGNGISGHVDIHFKNSRRHKDNRQDPQHQKSVKISAGLIK